MSKDWHLHKAIPITIFILVLGLAWKGGVMASQVGANTTSIVELKKGVRMMYDIKSSVARIEGALGIKK